mmetsp:Transcript_26136/g.43578  ORF Transcript_26136/g.43578 Transcript_26136/m.43578 type:complete len:248 (-) Transcript_26136:143-886(-)|eukprot:CAMPEP_0119003038 /NCGR_PEP_ID=MMETSP1176-20130426/316_1 /TAXON_ID=265551 /ORGANISM="Synedropsis recta cf, Strain CCMP1620" /LENGTH=247 /DNA_ID=CAMNT_0006954597 /DNA_START=309 /DNA_END=1052 /DNA_ORIENTATION=+
MLICKDGHRCENGSICTEKPNDEGGYYCDCDVTDNSVYAGLYCQHKATSYCTFAQEVSRISFCTNDGVCNLEVSPDAAHLGCDCQAGYEGDHCQFVDGTMPDSWPFDTSDAAANGFASATNGANTANTANGQQLDPRNDGDRGLQAGVTAVICLVVIAFLGTVAYVIYAKKKSHATPLASSKGAVVEDGGSALEADGSALQESIKSTAVADGSAAAAAAAANLENTESMEDIQLSASGDGPSESIII